jgi:transcriptional regulator with GAF, ATPase, and Fis domain
MFEFLDKATFFFEKIVGSNQAIGILIPFALALKLTIIFVLIKRSADTEKKTLPRQLLFLIITIIGLIASDLAWFIKVLQEMFGLNYSIVLVFIRISWGLMALQYQGLSLFIESLTEQKTKFNLRQKIFSSLSFSFFLFFLYMTVTNIGNQSPYDRPYIEFAILKAEILFLYFIIMPSTLFLSLRKLRITPLPRILKKQITTLLKVLIIPWFVCEMLQVFPFEFFSPGFVASSKAMAIMSTLLVTGAIYFAIRKILGLRFLNLKKQVQAAKQTYTFTFIDNFKDVLEQLSFATTITELGHITQAYFNKCFAIPLRRTTIYSRKYDAIHEFDLQHGVIKKTLQSEEPLSEHESKIQGQIEDFLSTADSSVHASIFRSKIIVHDEIAFNAFYENNPAEHQVLSLMKEINADIWLPIYDKQKMVAYIIIDRYARSTDNFYSNIEHDEMVVFANYLANIIHLLQNRNLDNLIQQEKELKEELHNKHQEINQYKESLRSFLRTSSLKKIGIIFYKSRRFIFANQSAEELIKINPNMQIAHPLSIALKNVAHHVIEYKTPHSKMVIDSEGNKLVLSGVPSLDHNNVIITAHHPELSDLLAEQINYLKDPSKWDYLLYLETTSSGQLINQLIPGNGETFLNFKIELLKTALSKKAILLDVPEEDLLPTVELIHHIGLREHLYTLNLTAPEKNGEIATKLFGINKLFLIGSSELGEPLFRRLHNTGTLYIKNIHFLSSETQEYLAEYFRYGHYRTFKTEQKITANVRIVCSSYKDLSILTHEKKFSRELFTELKKTSLVMPSLLTVADSELNTLTDGFAEQALQEKTYKNLLELNSKEKEKLITQRPVSLKELRSKVQQQLISKSKKNEVYEETQFDPAYEISDPELMEAARLGKHALRDPRVLSLLWRKFGNQAKIASFLGVNRSSVNRRLKEHNLY